MTEMIRLDRDRHINPEHVMHLGWDHRAYAYGPSQSILTVTMMDGSRHRIEHQPQYGIDAYAVETSLLDALKSLERLQNAEEAVRRLVKVARRVLPQVGAFREELMGAIAFARPHGPEASE